ncbi:MAG TPA: hypothetical protein VE981_05985 [Planctomycetota bacterium]|nr:hypothetical protein [Planctomycetota bacterium]
MEEHDEDAKPAKSRGRAAFILTCIFVALVIFGWQVFFTSKLEITAVARPAEFLLKGRTNKPGKLWIHVSGWIDGRAFLSIGDLEPQALEPGNVEWSYRGPRVTPECLLKYRPGTVTMGHLTVEYRLD